MREASTAGMTLLEVVVALAIVGVALVSGYEAYATGSDLQQRVAHSLDAVSAESRARALVVGWLRRPVLSGPETGFHGLDLRWQGVPDDRLEFWVLGATPRAPGLRRVALYVDREEATPHEGLVAAIEGRAGLEIVELIPEVGALELRFRRHLDEGVRELDAWSSQSLAPNSVVIRLEPAPGRQLAPLASIPWVVTVGAGR